MRILFDISHPAHVHFFRHMIPELQRRGHATSILSRDKDVTNRLLDAFGMNHTSVGRPSQRGRPGQLLELVNRNLALVRHGRRFKADVIVTRNPAGVQAARLLGATGIFDTDDGYSAGVHFRAAVPFAHYITSPDCLTEDLGPRHVKYAGYKQSAYLHPDHYTPDRGIFAELGLEPSDRYFVLRFVALLASHDKGEAGMSMALKREVIGFLERHGRVFLSSESGLPAEWKHLEFRLPPHRAHDLLAFATLVLGDSGSMPIEAAVLGTPAVHVSSYTGRLRPLNELEHRYGLAWSYEPAQSTQLMSRLEELVSQPDPRQAVASGYARMLAEKINVADWFCNFIERVGEARPALRRAE